MLCSICINTYKRPKLLKKLLDSISDQHLNSDILLEIIVVDNDPEKQAENVVKEFQQISTTIIKYFEQPIKNISLTRNKAVKEATGEFILFIDDDGYAEINWISEMINCLTNYKAGVVFGTVIPYFDDEVPEWIKKSHFFDRLIQNTGELSKFWRTGNCIIRSNLIKSIDGPFKPEFGLTGGEDIDLFGRLSNMGTKFVYCAEAIVYDFVPKERANLKWLSKRTFRIGITHTSRVLSLSKFKLGIKIFEFTKRVLYVFLSGFLFLITSPVRITRYYWYLKIISNLGHIAAVFNIRYKEYKD